jgi:hypothetical protein
MVTDQVQGETWDKMVVPMMKKSTSLISLSPPLSTYTVWVFLTGTSILAM